MLLFGILAVVAVTLIGVGLTAVEGRKVRPLVFRCGKCGGEFTQAAHLDYPKRCALCGAVDWAH
ncbi:MAG TPA: hypothetical protein VGM90_08935 [Kofleriaceae bacterium]|jgi:ribosomal protein S27AE